MEENEHIYLEKPEEIVAVNEHYGMEKKLYLYILTKSILEGTPANDILDSLFQHIEIWNGKDSDGKVIQYLSFKTKPYDYDKYVKE